MPLHRRVFFIAGFDPKSPRFYHHLFRALAAHPAPGAEGAGVQVGPRRGLSDIADEWDLHAPQASGAPLHTRCTLLRWDDLVRAHWARTPGRVLGDHGRLYTAPHGLLRTAWRESRVNWVLLVLPLCLGLLVVLGWLAAGVALGGWWAEHPGAGAALALGALAWPAWRAWLALSRRVGSDWLLRLYGFSHQQAAGRVPGLQARTDAFAALIAAAPDDDPGLQEVLVVGHSTGATLAAAALARALARRPGLGANGPAVALLTIGHCTPLVYCFHHAGALRDELAALTAHPPLAWVDYTAPADWAGTGRMPPWPRPGPALLRRLSPRFPKLLSPARYAALRRNRLAMHMQYLKPMDHAGRYDLLALLAGAPTLRARHQEVPDDYRDSDPT